MCNEAPHYRNEIRSDEKINPPPPPGPNRPRHQTQRSFSLNVQVDNSGESNILIILRIS